MKAAYLECFSGISGNMFLGALLDAGLPEQLLKETLAALKITGYRLAVTRVEKCGIRATHVDVDMTSKHQHRHLSDILQIIERSGIDNAVKHKASSVFRRLAAAEAKVHGTSIEKVHFHEVGAVDAIVDIVGVAFGLHWLGIDLLYASELKTGKGFVKAAHGVMPIPAPATAELLHGIPWQSGTIEKELVTPTGAALVAELCSGFGERPQGFRDGITAYGAGTWELSIPNITRLSIGHIDSAAPNCWLLETNIDDSTPEILSYTTESLFALGALDVWISPIIMKKGRPGFQLSVLTTAPLVQKTEQMIFAETSTIGIRRRAVDRAVADRVKRTVATPWGNVSVKIASFAGHEVNVSPEYEECRRIAVEKCLPLKYVYQHVMAICRKDNS